jgi:hypothetical protein
MAVGRRSLIRLVAGCLFAAGCASSRPDTDVKSIEAGRESPAGRPAAGSGSAAGANAGAGSSARAGGAAPAECLGPGRYERGKGSVYRPCCDGLTEIATGKTGYRGRSNDEYEPSCEPPPLYVFACVRGSCGDGICDEAGEAPACGCVVDCPQAAFTWEDTARLGQLSGVPTSCKREDLLARLQPTAGQDCGDLALGASAAEREASLTCARNAIAESKPFRVFWKTQGTDSIVHGGVVGRVQAGELRLFSLYVDAEAFGINFSGATASWSPCKAAPAPQSCESSPADCLSCADTSGDIYCGCLPKGMRPGMPPGASVELRCEKSS